MKIMTIWGVLLISLVLSGCKVVQYYKSSDIKKSLSANKKSANQTMQSVQKDYQKRNAAYQQLVSKTSDSSLSPYPQLSKVLSELSAQVSQMQILHNKLQKMEGRLDRIFSAKKEIESDSPEWDEIQKIRGDYGTTGKQLISATSDYQKKTKEFDALLESHYITQVNMKDLRSQVSTSQNELNTGISKANQGLAKARTELAKLKKNTTADKKKILVYESKINEMQAVLNELPPKQKKLNVLVAIFTEEVGENNKLWVGPGMRSYTILHDLKAIGLDINQTIKRYNALVELQ